ncbi:phage tail protein [Acinetobacter ursingii]|uniref:phage tail protein n=1 Tax=Acinetobacter ursingii TaxID=108980 RepID=UPI003AF61992
MAAQYHSLFTTQGLALLREAIQNGTKLGITHMAYGDGNGIVPTPNADFTKLVKEVYRTPLNRLAPSDKNPNWLEADGVISSAVGGFNIREVGLYAGNVLVAYANYPPTYKPAGGEGTAQIKTIRIVLQIDNTANFELKIDASVVMATIQAVEDVKLEIYQNTVNTVQSIEDLLNIKNPWDGQIVNVESYHAVNYALPTIPVVEGGGIRRYVAALKNINDGGVCINGWLLQKATYNYLTPEMFGAKGIGSTFNDYQSIQNMLNAGAEGCTFTFDGAKTYYNAFDNELTDPWQDEDKRKQWTRNKRCIFKFNGAKLTRRVPRWNDNNNHDNYNSGQFYTEDRTALLKISGNGPWYMHDANFDSNVPFGAMLSHSGNYDYTDDTYCRGTAMDWGLRMENVTDFFCTNSIFQRSVFCVSAVNCSNINFTMPTFKYGAQAEKRVNANDLALGAGIKLEHCKGVKLIGVYGYKNANDTVELERDNDDVTVTGSSDYDVANSMMLYSSSNVKLDWTGRNIIKGTGVSLIQSGEHSSNFVSGKINIQNCYGTGVLIRNYDDVSQDLLGIDLDITTENCAYGGLIINNTHDTYMPRGLKINHTSINDGSWLTSSRQFAGKMTGDVWGKDVRNATTKSYSGFIVSGTNTKATCLRLNLDLTQVDQPWVISENSFVSFFGTKTSWGTFYLDCLDTTNIGNTGAGLNLSEKKGTINMYSYDTVYRAGLNKMQGMTTESNNQNFTLFYDTSDEKANGTGKSYPVRIHIDV